MMKKRIFALIPKSKRLLSRERASSATSRTRSSEPSLGFSRGMASSATSRTQASEPSLGFSRERASSATSRTQASEPSLGFSRGRASSATSRTQASEPSLGFSRERASSATSRTRAFAPAVIFLILALCISGISLCSCAKAPSEEEARALVSARVDESFELMEIYFGKGLPYEAGKPASGGGELYRPVTENSKYKKISEIKEATRLVFTSDYCETLFQLAFTGYASGTGTTAYARYIESGGVLTVNSEYEPLTVNQYDTKTVKITKCTKNFIEAEISTSDGKSGASVTLYREDGVWLLDTPTY